MGGKSNLLQAIVGGALLIFGGPGTWMATLGRSLLAGVVLGAVGKALQKKPSASGATMAAQGRLETVRQALGPRQVVYGRCRVGGTLTFFETTTDNQTALMITTLTGHPVSAIRDVYYNDRSTLDYGSHGSGSAATGKFGGYSTIYRSNGSEGASQPFADLVARGLSWASTDLQRDCAKVHTTHLFSNEVWQTGLPQVSCVINGVADIIDPRLGSPTSSGWTNNPALCIAHYLASADGLGAEFTAEIDQDTLIASANICDERVTLSGDRAATVQSADATNDWLTLAVDQPHADFGDGVRLAPDSPGTLPGGLSEGVTYYAIPVWEGDVAQGQIIRLATSHANAIAGSYIDISSAGSGTFTLTFYDEPRYRLNGAFSLTEKPQAVIERMLTAMAGKLVNSGGVWYIYAGAYSTPTLTFDEDDFAGPIDIQTNVSRSESANAVKGTFVDPSSRYQPVDFPAIVSQTYYQEDGGERVYRDLDLTAFVTSGTQAQRLAKIDLITSRLGLTCHARFKLSAFRMMTGATIAITNTQLGWTAKAFEVVNCTLVIERDGRLEVDATLRETAAEVYDWDVADEQLADLAPNTNLPDPTTVSAPTGLAFSQSGSVYDTAILQFTAPGDSFVVDYQAAYRITDYGSPDDAEYTLTSFVPATYIEIPRLNASSYQFKVRAKNNFGALSDWSDVVTGEMPGDFSFWIGSLNATGMLRRIDEIEVSGSSLIYGMCWNPRNNLVYAPDFGAAKIFVFNPSLDQLVQTIDAPVSPANIEFCPIDGNLYVQHDGVGGPPTHAVSIFNPLTQQWGSPIGQGDANVDSRGTFCPTDGRMWMNNSGVNAIDPADQSVENFSFSTGSDDGICFCPSNGYLYVINSTFDHVKVVDPLSIGSPSSDMVVATITLRDGPRAVCYCPENDRIYVACFEGDAVIVIDPASNTVESEVGGSPALFNGPIDLCYSPATRLLYVIEDFYPSSSGRIRAIRPADSVIVNELDLSDRPRSLVYVPTAQKLYVANFFTSTAGITVVSI